MKWSEAIARIDWNDPKQVEGWVTIEGMAESLGISSYNTYAYCNEIVQTRLDEVWLYRWLCTDTYVGARAYFLDKELVAISWQSARKNTEHFYYTSEEAVAKLVGFVRSLDEFPEYHLADLDKEIPE